MDLPTYTNIWRIEKRLYKLYDFRLPMPLPVGQIAVFLLIAVPYVLVLTVLGLPFSHTLLWVYVLPPGVLAWLTTRPVLESKRLPELVISQVRYLLQPRTWCRMAPLAEKDDIIVVCRVWRQADPEPDLAVAVAVAAARLPARQARTAAQPLAIASRSASRQLTQGEVAQREVARGAAAPERAVQRKVVPGRAVAGGVSKGTDAERRVPQRQPAPGQDAERAPRQRADPGRVRQRAVSPGQAAREPVAEGAVAFGPPAQPQVVHEPVGHQPGPQPQGRQVARAGAGPAAADAAARAADAAAAPAADGAAAQAAADRSAAAALAAADRSAAAAMPPAATGPPSVATPPGDTAAADSQPFAGREAAAGSRAPGESEPAGVPPPRPARPVVTVTGDLAAERPLRVVERALRSQPGQRKDGWHDRVVVVPGGHRPGKPDQLQRDRARARLAVGGPRRIVVLGCTRGAGQTTTVLLAGDMLAGLRGEPVAVLDLNPGRGSLTERAAAIPGLMPGPLEAGHLSAGGLPAAGPLTAGPGPAAAPMPAPVAADAQPPDTGLQVISGGPAAHGGDDAGRILDLVAARYKLTLADPAAGCVPRTLDVADQLVIVAPASAAAANALAMTFEWLEAHGHDRLAAAAVTVLNGVSGPTSSHVEHAAAVASGRCRAIVKVPWDSHLKDLAPERRAAPGPQHPAPGPHHPAAGAYQPAPVTLDADQDVRDRAAGPADAVLAAPTDPWAAGLLSPALTQAYTALAGVLIAGLAEPGELRSARG